MKSERVYAPDASRKLSFARDMNTPVYIYGATGFGKTTLVRSFVGDDCLWLDASGLADFGSIGELLDDAENKPACVVIDEMQYLDSDARREKILSLIRRADVWTVLIGRMPTPRWLIPLIVDCRLTVITENDLRFRQEQIKALAAGMGMELSAHDLAFIEKGSEGNVLCVVEALQWAREGKPLDESASEGILQAFATHLEDRVISRWTPELREFMMKLSVVDTFTLPLAETITGDDQAQAMLDEASNAGNFLFRQGEVYHIRPELCIALRRCANKLLGSNRIRQCAYNAGLYYEMHDDVLRALEMYDRSGNAENMRSLLIRNGRRNPGAGYYYELRSYYMDLHPEDVENSAVLMSALSMLYAVLLNVEQSEYWYGRLKRYANETRGTEKAEAETYLFYLDVALPHRGSEHIPELIRHSVVLLRRSEHKLPEFSITNNQPSVMNGGKDFCAWSRQDTLLAETIGKPLEAMLGRNGRGLVHTALGESYFEKGMDNYETVSRLSRAQIEIEGGGSIELLFAVVGLQIRMGILTGNMQNAAILMDGFERRVRKEKADRLLPNVAALQCRMALYSGDMSAVRCWMEKAPDETVEFCTLERYRYLTKARCYLALGQYPEAILLLERMRYFSEISKRIYIHMESAILLAIVREKVHEEWRQILLDGLKEAADYRFVRVISELGVAILPLLKRIRQDYLHSDGADTRWFARVLAETEQIANRYPAYLNIGGVSLSDFPDTALTVLRMQAAGRSVKEIAAALDISERTVKYHAAENYRKLNVKGKTEAVQKARSLNLL